MHAIRYYVYVLTMWLVAGHCTALAQHAAALGHKAPNIHVTDWIQPTQPADWTGKYIVLDFWATWCHNCLAEQPRLNALARELARENVVFLSMTYESAAKVQRVLNKIPFETHVVTDTTQATQRGFGDPTEGLPYLPYTVLIDPKGSIQWVGTARQLTTEQLRAFMHGATMHNTQDKPAVHQTVPPCSLSAYLSRLQNPAVRYDVELSPSLPSDDVPPMTMRSGQFTWLHEAEVTELLAAALSCKKEQIIWESDIPKGRYTLFYKNMVHPDTAAATLRHLILDFLHVQVQTAQRSLLLPTLNCKNKALLTPAKDHDIQTINTEQQWLLYHYSWSDLAAFINQHTSCSVGQVPSDSAFYDFEVSASSEAALWESLARYGLTLGEKQGCVMPVYLVHKN